MSNSLNLLHDYFKSEVNSIELEETSEEDKYVTYDIEFNHRSLGQRLKKQYNNEFRTKVSKMSKSDIKVLVEHGEIEIGGIPVYKDDVFLHKKFKDEVTASPDVVGITSDEYAILIDYSSDPEIEKKHLLREFITRVQKFRKELDLSIDDNIQVYYSSETQNLNDILQSEREFVETSLLKQFQVLPKEMENSEKVKMTQFELGDEKGTIYIYNEE